jgi:isopenicillin-N N-acyltransferase like protein
MIHRRAFLAQAAGWAAAAAAGPSQASPPKPPAGKAPPPAPDHAIAVISGSPRERGRQYGRQFKDAIRAFLEQEIYGAFAKNPPRREDLLRYAALCMKPIARQAPIVMEELQGMAESTGLTLEEQVAVTCHEEFWHRGVLPAADHCTAIACGPPDTSDGGTYVGQNWDWMTRLYGLSRVLLWKRPEGPSVISYAYPGLWIAAGMNSAGIALCWTSTPGEGIPGPRVGLPSYVLIAEMLYQDTLDAAVEAARRSGHAGWFTFVLADGQGRLANVEGSPREMAVQWGRGHMARVYFGTAQMTHTPPGKPIKRHPQCQRMLDLLAGSKGRLDRPTLQGFFGDHESTICKHYGTLDSMLFNTARREAYVSRGPGCSGRWRRFTFADSVQT